MEMCTNTRIIRTVFIVALVPNETQRTGSLLADAAIAGDRTVLVLNYFADNTNLAHTLPGMQAAEPFCKVRRI